MRSATLADLVQDARSWRLRFELPQALMRYVAPKGSICINGVSLTVNKVSGRTLRRQHHSAHHEVTTLGELAVGDGVNVEIDVIARYLSGSCRKRASVEGEEPDEHDRRDSRGPAPRQDGGDHGR